MVLNQDVDQMRLFGDGVLEEWSFGVMEWVNDFTAKTRRRESVEVI